MPNFRRYYIPNALVFITNVLRDRRPLFADPQNVELLFSTMRTVQQLHLFHLLACAIMPDHVHLMMFTEAPITFSTVMQSIKTTYTKNYKAAQGIAQPLSLWQSRFWDHVIRDEDDLARHIDYIHYNPVKHALTLAPGDWPYSTFTYWLERGFYTADWGRQEPTSIERMHPE